MRKHWITLLVVLGSLVMTLYLLGQQYPGATFDNVNLNKLKFITVSTPASPPAGLGWSDGDRIYIQDGDINSGVYSSIPRHITLTSDVPATNTTPVAFANFTVAANKTYAVDCEITLVVSSSSDIPKFEAVCPASPTNSSFCSLFWTGATTPTNSNAACGALMSGNTTSDINPFGGNRLTGMLQNGSNAGSLALEVASSGSYTTTVKAGSFCTLW